MKSEETFPLSVGSPADTGEIWRLRNKQALITNWGHGKVIHLFIHIHKRWWFPFMTDEGPGVFPKTLLRNSQMSLDWGNDLQEARINTWYNGATQLLFWFSRVAPAAGRAPNLTHFLHTCLGVSHPNQRPTRELLEATLRCPKRGKKYDQLMGIIHTRILKASPRSCVVFWIGELGFSKAALSNHLASPCNRNLTSDSPLELLELLGCEEQKLSVLLSVRGGGGGEVFSLPLMY